MRYHYRILNVFAHTTLGGNPLCVFEDGRGLDDATMQALARQFNLSETTFLLPSDNTNADALFRIFTVGYEMRFAGHPCLGTAHVLRSLRGGDIQRLECKGGVVPVSAQGDLWTLMAPFQGAPKATVETTPPAQLAAMLGLQESDFACPPVWLDTGTDQLLLQMRSVDAVRRAQPTGFALWPQSSLQRRTAYLFAFEDSHHPQNPGNIVARYFFEMASGNVAEDPGTGSACANLGGWLLAKEYPLPQRWQIAQGAAVQRPCFLQLEVSAAREIRVGGQVIELGRGYIDLP